MFLRLKRSGQRTLSRMRPAPKLARGQLAAGIGAERTANAANNETGGCHGGITGLVARICRLPRMLVQWPLLRDFSDQLSRS
jgi:hypothetical protein